MGAGPEAEEAERAGRIKAEQECQGESLGSKKQRRTEAAKIKSD